jgi:hypothetical protein
MLTYIVPTIGRPSLAATLASIEVWPGDEILVVAAVEPPGLGPACRYVPCPAGHDWGSRERNAAMPLARGSHLAFLDDDDMATVGARQIIADGIAAHPDRPIVYRMVYPDGRQLWTEPAIRFGNVGTPMFVIPNIPHRLGAWGSHVGGDYSFIADCGWRRQDIIWRTEVIARIGANHGAHVATLAGAAP